MKSVKPASSLEEGAKYMIEAMIEDYNETGYGTDTPDNYKVTEGRKYLKVVRKNSVTAFVLKEDYKHFRGNVIDGMYPIEWTGPLYLN